MNLKRVIYVSLLQFFLQGPSLFAQDSIPSYIITKGKLPQLAYSSGEDRLGSAKMGYIDTSVVMKVVDTVKNLYKVQLSAMHYAFIEQYYAQPFPDTMLSTAFADDSCVIQLVLLCTLYNSIFILEGFISIQLL